MKFGIISAFDMVLPPGVSASRSQGELGTKTWDNVRPGE